jgi:hypothetical protein
LAGTGQAEITKQEPKGRKPILVLTLPEPNICESYEYSQAQRKTEERAITELHEQIKQDYYLIVIYDQDIKHTKADILSESNTKPDDIERIIAIINEKFTAKNTDILK